MPKDKKKKKTKVKSLVKANDTSNIVKTLISIDDDLAGLRFSIDAFNDLKLSDDIDAQMDDVLSGYQMVGVLEAHAEERYDVNRVELDEYRGELDEYAREMEVMSRPTDTRVKSWIDRNEDYVAKKKRLIELKRKWSVLKYLNKAYYMKYELLRTKSANLRRETGDLSAAPGNTNRFPRP